MKILKEMSVKQSILREGMQTYSNPDWEPGYIVFELPDGFVYYAGNDPGAATAEIYEKDGILANATAETFRQIRDENVNEVSDWVDFSPRYERVTIRQALMSAKDSLKSIGCRKADLLDMISAIESDLGEGSAEW